jgi:uncharacterized ferritin-like protein (DUF455 family)
VKLLSDPTPDIDAFARLVLLGTTLEEKLAEPPPERESPERRRAFARPPFPGRPPKLARIGNAKFPAAASLDHATARGQVLHFFANHELLAMELMALVLLEFPDAPDSFRLGLARTIEEEQHHMQLYLGRMHELGVEFGDLPLTDYFWHSMKGMRSPLEFVTQMSLTFEQANLDFSLHYRDEMARHGDAKTAAILEQVYRDEVGHVKHGLLWFNRWREHPESETDWAAYKRLLPPPLTPRRAKGATIFSVEARREAGLSETFIRELEIYAGSKGRPPLLWRYNPSCEAEIVRGAPGHTPSSAVRRLTNDLAPLLMVLARDSDMLWIDERPRLEWLREMADCGFRIPEFVESLDIREPKLGGLEPWGWSPEVFAAFRPLRDRLLAAKGGRSAWNKSILDHEDFAATGFGRLFAKSWSANFLHRWLVAHPETRDVFGAAEMVGTTANDPAAAVARIDALFGTGHAVVLKGPWGTAGNRIRRLRERQDLDASLEKWIRSTIGAQGSIVVEPWLDKLHDLSIQIEVQEGDRVRLLGARQFITDSRWQYRGTILGSSFRGLSAESLRFVHHALPRWSEFARDVGRALGAAGYRGPAGLDAMVWKTPEGALRFKPMNELNPRWTMGRVALALERHVAPGARAIWIIVPKDMIDAAAARLRHPAVFIESKSGKRVAQGVVFTTDPQAAQAVLTALVVGEAALSGEAWLPS